MSDTLKSRRFYVTVPLNDQGCVERGSFDLGYSKMKNVYFDYFNWEELDKLCDLLEEWNDEFDVWIGAFEDDWIEVEQQPRAMEILERHIANSDDPAFLAAAEKLRKALTKAMEVKQILFLDF